MAYKYYLGATSNFKNRSMGSPIIIGADASARERLNRWLDLMEMDLDELMEAINVVLKSEIVTIIYNRSDTYTFYLENGKEAMFDFCDYDDEHPRFMIKYENVLYFCNPRWKGKYIEQIGETVGSINFSVSFDLNHQRFSMKEDNDLVVAFEINDISPDFYEKLKSKVHSIQEVDGMIKLLEIILLLTTNKKSNTNIRMEISRLKFASYESLMIRECKIERYYLKIGEDKYMIEGHKEAHANVVPTFTNEDGEKALQYETDYVMKTIDAMYARLEMVKKILEE